MKVVLFCGGLGLRIREYSERVPKPMVPIGNQPILWHVMKYYSYFGHRDFILCLGHQGSVIKNYFLNQFDAFSSDFILSEGGKNIELLGSDSQDWTITFVDTGTSSNVGQRLKAVEDYLEGEEIFLANYCDGVTNFSLDHLVDSFTKSDQIAAFLSVRPVHSFHIVSTSDNGVVDLIQHIANSDVRINGGYYIFRNKIFDYIHEGEELIEEPFQRLIKMKKLTAYKYDGYWACMDTLKDKYLLDEMYAKGEAPWEMWKAY